MSQSRSTYVVLVAALLVASATCSAARPQFLQLDVVEGLGRRLLWGASGSWGSTTTQTGSGGGSTVVNTPWYSGTQTWGNGGTTSTNNVNTGGSGTNVNVNTGSGNSGSGSGSNVNVNVGGTPAPAPSGTSTYYNSNGVLVQSGNGYTNVNVNGRK